MQFQFDSKTVLNSAFKLKANKLNTNVCKQTLTNFGNLIINYLMTGLYRFIPSLLSFDWQNSPHCVNECVKEFKIHSVETVSEVSRRSNVNIATYVKQKT